MNTKEIQSRLASALTQYDAAQSKRKGWNPHALGIYFERLEAVIADMESGTAPRQALLAGFNDRLLDVCLKAIGEPRFTIQEKQDGTFVYNL